MYKQGYQSFGQKIIECSDGGLVIIGKSAYTSIGDSKSDVVLAKVVSNTKVSTHSIHDDNTFSVYPNPVWDVLYYSNGKQNTNKYLIYSIDGKTIESGIAIQGKLSVSNLNPGLYYIQFLDVDRKSGVVLKFVKL